MNRAVGRILSLLASSSLAALTILTAPAAQAGWAEQSPGSVDVVIDWYEVPDAAGNPVSLEDECAAAQRLAAGLFDLDFDPWLCKTFSARCADAVDQEHPGHAARVVFYYGGTGECRAIGAS